MHVTCAILYYQTSVVVISMMYPAAKFPVYHASCNIYSFVREIFSCKEFEGLAGTHRSPSAITYASPLSSAAIRPDPNSLPSPVEQKQDAAASQAISVAAQHFTYAALLILCSCDEAGQVKDFNFNSGENCKSKDHHSLTPIPGFSLAYSGYTGPGNSAGNMTALLPDWNSEAIPMMQLVLFNQAMPKSIDHIIRTQFAQHL